MRTLRLIGRGLADTLEHLLPFTLLTLAWWASQLLVVPGPAATVALFAMTDPRRAVDRPEWREAVAAVRVNLRRGWGLALLTLPVLAVLFANLDYYGRGGSRWAILVPLWTVLLLLAIAVALYAFAVAGLTDAGIKLALKRGAILAGIAPFRALAVTVIFWLLISIGGVLVVPLVMFMPAAIAAIVNRVVLYGLGLPVVDPLAPTEEREAEERARASASKFGP